MSNVKNLFVIRKTYAAYLVTVTGMEAIVELVENRKASTINKTISDTLQTIANTKLLLMRPDDPVAYLKSYFESKKWSIENAS